MEDFLTNSNSEGQQEERSESDKPLRKSRKKKDVVESAEQVEQSVAVTESDTDTSKEESTESESADHKEESNTTIHSIEESDTPESESGDNKEKSSGSVEDNAEDSGESKEEPKQPAPKKKKKKLIHIDTYLNSAKLMYNLSAPKIQGYKSYMTGHHYSYDEKVFDTALKEYLNIK